MKSTIGRNSVFRSLPFSFWPALVVVGCLLWTASGLAQAPPPGGDYGPTNVPLASWSFQDPTNWTSDQGWSPISFTNLAFSNLGDGASLVVDSNVPAWLQYYVYEPTNAATNLTVDSGSVTFWFGPDWASTNQGGTGPGQWVQLIDVGEWTTNSSYGYWGLSVDPQGQNLWFVSQDGAGNTYTLSTPVSLTTNYFHFIALTYSSTNVSLYWDGQLATNDPGGLSVWPAAGVLSNGVFFGSDTNGQMQAAGLFNLVATYDYPLDSNDVQTIFNWYYGYYMISPWNIPYMDNLSSAPANPTYTPTFDAITGQGNLQWVANAANCVSNANPYNIWITNVTARAAGNGTMNITFTIEGGWSGVPYDVFANSVLSFGPNGAPWTWEGQGYQCNTYMLTNMPNTTCFLILGTPQDTSGSGLTDAYELLVAKVNPDGSQTDSYGVPYAWYAENGLVPITSGLATQDPDKDGLLNWQEYEYGTRPTVSEGMAIWVSTPNGNSSIP